MGPIVTLFNLPEWADLIFALFIGIGFGFALEQAGLTIEAIAHDKKKPKQVFLKPLVWAIRLYSAFRPKKERVRLWHDELTGPVILEGGNTLIIIARKP